MTIHSFILIFLLTVNNLFNVKTYFLSIVNGLGSLLLLPLLLVFFSNDIRINNLIINRNALRNIKVPRDFNARI